MTDSHDNLGLDALVRAIESLQERIRRDGETIGSNEIRTRTTLVDPLLNALGWDTTDPAMVVPEYAAGGGVADYALLKVTPDGGSPVIAFIEAKRLHEPLEPHRSQMLTYANMSGVRYAGLTNGDRWEFYIVFKEAPLHERRILDVSLLHESAFDCAIHLLPLKWPSPEARKHFSARDTGNLLVYAFQTGTEASLEIIDMLLGWSADPQASDYSGWTPLHFAAAYYEDPEIIQVLVNHGVDIEAVDDEGRTPLYCAVASNTSRIVMLLLDFGADINAKDNQGWTPLHRAALEAAVAGTQERLTNASAKIELLLRRGASFSVVDNNDKTPYQIAEKEYADEEVLRLLTKP